MGRIPEDLIKKIENNIDKIGNDIRDFKGVTDGDYIKIKDKCIKLPHIFNWTQSFFTGMALWAYLDTDDKKFLDWAEQFKQEYYDKVFKTPLDTMHDTGFLYSPYAVMLYKITGKEEYKEIGIQAANDLLMRFLPNGGYIRAWGRMDNKIPDYVDSELAKDNFFANSEGLAIVDCMMNIPLLFWASEVTGQPFYKRVAMMHADTTMNRFVREDGSVMHAFRFDENTGEALHEDNDCGYSVGSHWARGTSWAIYGFAIAYRYTNKKEYLETSIKLLDKFMQECGNDIPVWDFRLPDDVEHALDTSATAITLCGVIELQKHANSEELKEYNSILKKALEPYINYDENVMGVLKEQDGKHVYSPYGDYFLIESFMKENSNIEIW